MTTEPKPENSLDEDPHFSSELSQMSETELVFLLDMVERLEADFRFIPLHNSESLSSVVAARNLLEIWNREIGQILLGKQEMDTSVLHHWDSEGEMITPSRRVTARIEDGKRRLVWADTE